MSGGRVDVEHVQACSEVTEAYAVSLRYGSDRTETIHYCQTVDRARGYAEAMAEQYSCLIRGVPVPKIVVLKVRHEVIYIYKPIPQEGKV